VASTDELYKLIRIKEITEVARDFKLFTLDANEPIPYQAGQYITFVDISTGNEIRRSYSMTSCPGIDKEISIGVKRIPNGFFSRRLFDHAKCNDNLFTSGVGGRFILPANTASYTQLFLFAAGSGITPVYSILKHCLYFYPSLHVTLVYSNHSAFTTIFKKELETLAALFTDRLKIEWLFSNAANLTSARLYRDLLIRIVQTTAPSSYKNALYYVCGPLPYMRMCTFVLHEMNVPPENIRRENFLIAQPPPVVSLPPDRDTHTAFIHYRENSYSIPVHFPDSILQAAKKAAVILPYSCETGRCANCIARCIKGNIWLSHNEVITEKEMANGLTLTCVGHPVGGDVELVIE
jgi:ferredoxin-NADP reductase